MKGNIYHIVSKKPALEAWEMPPELEELANELLKSGLLRIDAYDQTNFVRFLRPHERACLFFSHYELLDPQYIPQTLRTIEQVLEKSIDYTPQDAQDSLERLQNEARLSFQIEDEAKLKIARIAVQAADPVVIKLLLLEKTQLFISYSHTVGDMLDVSSWQVFGSSSGLQSTEGNKSAAVFVSCGGSPIASAPEDYDESQIFGDGPPALARFMVIGGQELGHYSDIIRDKYGNYIGRHSSNIYGTKAKKNVRLGRIYDINICNKIYDKLIELGLSKAVSAENDAAFYKKQTKISGAGKRRIRKAKRVGKKFLKICKKNNMGYVLGLPESQYPATQINMAVQDMLFNLAPQADAYKRSNPKEEEAVACIEALARIPQQVNKWGHSATKHMMPNLYKIYYEQLIPSCIKAYENLSGMPYNFTLSKPKIPLSISIKRFFGIK
ncbi:DUF2748 family protein [Rickettsiales bacterium]|nr:DUF2748 family protein [Rickettsiales bacterium]